MLKFVVLLSVVACAVAGTIPDGLLPQLDGRIVGGYETSIEDHPYQVSLQRSGSHFCGGSIYSHDIVITAAHCLQSIEAKDLKVRVGSTYWRSGGSVHSVRAFRNHEGYNSRTMVNDIAIIRIESDLSFRSTIRAISIADSNPREGAIAVVSGWGTTESGGSTIPDHLLAVDLEIVEYSRCRSSEFGYGRKIKDTMICAYSAHKDACQGDSGGPLVSGNRLVGVVSWGYGCGDVRYPGVYADVAHFHEWIERTADEVSALKTKSQIRATNGGCIKA
ncbi:trypsin epsilon [Drosophila eugracilis]|uniref:trypsin epsilon n=1 Tax=Drosophila eugracilis TaxID=29029 RepID=UPI0007E64DB7|nr:trypsin epsilon [Drosophila eugracilis]